MSPRSLGPRCGTRIRPQERGSRRDWGVGGPRVVAHYLEPERHPPRDRPLRRGVIMPVPEAAGADVTLRGHAPPHALTPAAGPPSPRPPGSGRKVAAVACASATVTSVPGPGTCSMFAPRGAPSCPVSTKCPPGVGRVQDGRCVQDPHEFCFLNELAVRGTDLSGVVRAQTTSQDGFCPRLAGRPCPLVHGRTWPAPEPHPPRPALRPRVTAAHLPAAHSQCRERKWGDGAGGGGRLLCGPNKASRP